MDIYTYLKKDHRKVEEMMEQLLATQDPTDRQELFEQIKQELTLHADTEEATFYAAIEKATRSKQVEEKMEHADDEHDEIREYLEKLSALPIDGEEWMEQFGEFKHSVAHHVEEEEGEIFKKAKQYLSDEKAKQLARDMDAMKQKQLQGMQAA